MTKERTFYEIIKRFFEPLKLRPLMYFKLAFVSILWWINAVVHVLFLERITFYLQNFDKTGFKHILLYYIVFIIFYEVLNFSLKNWGWVETIPFWIADMYRKYLNKYVILDHNHIEKIWTWKLVWIINSWIDKWANMLAELFVKWTWVLIAFLFAVYMILKVNYIYSFLFFVLFVIFMIFSIYFNKKLVPYRKQRYEYRNMLLKYLVKVLMNKQEIMQSWKIDKELKNMYLYSEKLSKINKDMWTYRQLLQRTSQFWMTLILLFTFYFLWNKVLSWDIELNVIVWLSWVLIIMQKTITEAVSFYVQMTKDFTDVEKLWDFFDKTPEMKWYDIWKEFEYKKWEIEVKNLNYSYVENKPVFENFNLKLKWWKIIAFVWNSGSGKSTLVKLIAGYIHPDKWDIIVDWQKLSEVSLKSYYKNVGYLTQEPSVFDGTIIDNLTYAIDRKLEKQELEEVIKQAKCEFIYDLEKWLDTEIWERWVRLSWWQKQRLAIAKIFLKNPKIIILDEPTSALDSFSEEQITIAMHNLFKWRTVIVIAHRLQTVKEADDIILFENGKIKERWTHNELVELKWDYYKMLELQSGF